MDALSEALNSVRMTGAIFFDAICTKPWGFAVPAIQHVAHLLSPGTERLLGYHLVTEGTALVRLEGAPDVPVAAGDIVIIPHGDPWPEIGRKAVVAWKPGREAARAVFDALPLLRQAETVKILEAGEESAVPRPAESGGGLAAALARHGIEAATERCAVPNRHAGEAICDFVSRESADLLVMGAYGHSRFREILFGGATRHVARHMPAPTLFSH